ncbi:hypothetical protein B5M09_007644 [Aphanomyces astaci]|uniref:GAG-pre-integrase domain-containing protein n=1 Tax=Aphanomyces astaci TaxID=112090 RepID=A0A425DE72_APHAT|nr:hypothetical protein B5M09_007644 [Aphanomyces astaci]
MTYRPSRSKFQTSVNCAHICDIIDGTYVIPDDAAEVKAFVYEDKTNMAKSYLQKSLSNEVFDMICEDSTPAEMRRTLVLNYERKELSNTVYWLLISFPDSSLDNYNSFINHLKPTPGHVVKRKALTIALLKCRERKRGNRHDECHDRPRDAERQRKRTYEAKDIEDMTLEINALKTRLTELRDKRRKTDDSLLWCYIWKKKGDPEAKGHPGYDPNYVNKRTGGGGQSQRGHMAGNVAQVLPQMAVTPTPTLRNTKSILTSSLTSACFLQDVAPRAAAECINATTLVTDKTLDPRSDTKLRQWHNKLNHTGMRQVAKIIQLILLPSIDSSTNNHICDGCAQGQAKHISFRNTHHYVPADPLECLNGNLCGRVSPRTVNHELFTSMFIDQASRYIFGKLLKTKDDTILHLDALVSDLN